MINGSIPIAFLPAGLDGCALYRMYLPYLNTPNSTFLFPAEITQPLDINDISHCKVALVQRQVSQHNLLALKRIHEAGIKLVYDLDDDLWNLPAANPGRDVFNANREGFAMCARECDVLTVSTMGLRTAATTSFDIGRKHIEVIPNGMDYNLFRPMEMDKADDTVVIGWGGSNTHSEDTLEAFEIIPEVLDANPKARMEIVGAQSLERQVVVNKLHDGRSRRAVIMKETKISKHPQCSFRSWVNIAEYPNRLACWKWDIALAPLADIRFNKSKSAIKGLESGAMKIPCLMSNVQPYYELASLGGTELKWLLCDSQRHWKEKLTVLINEPARRQYLGELLYRTGQKFFNMENLANNWHHVFQTALDS